MKKILTIALLATVSAMFVAGFVSTLATQQAYAATASTGAFAANDFAAATGSSSSKGSSGSSSGFLGFCPDFAALGGSCSESD
jgi:hypothetical protein